MFVYHLSFHKGIFFTSTRVARPVGPMDLQIAVLDSRSCDPNSTTTSPYWIYFLIARVTSLVELHAIHFTELIL